MVSLIQISNLVFDRKAHRSCQSPSRRSPSPCRISSPRCHTHSLSSSSMMDDDSILKSIFAKAADIPTAHVRVDFDSSSKQRVRDFSRTSGLSTDSRRSSGVIFAGFESFEEVRRGFEFNNNRPAFYPPSSATRCTLMDSKTHCLVLLRCPLMGGSPIQVQLIHLTMACLAYMRGRPLKMYWY
jgi:hypothetical protein